MSDFAITKDTYPASSNAHRFPAPLALAVVLLMGAAYTAIDMRVPEGLLQAALAILPGGMALAALWASGLDRSATRMRFAPLSRKGAAALAAVTLVMLPILGSSSGFIGWQWLPALVYAPASGVAQELYFRASLLPAMERALPGRQRAALFVHAGIFVAWHLRTFLAVGFQGVALVIVTVIFTAGCLWGWQVQKDRTVVWAMAQHSLFLIIMSMFGWG